MWDYGWLCLGLDGRLYKVEYDPSWFGWEVVEMHLEYWECVYSADPNWIDPREEAYR
jgi:hypothetical protein